MKRGVEFVCAMAVLAGMAVPVFGRNIKIELPEGSSLKIEHLAFSYSGHMYLDGPRLEAQCPVDRPGSGGMDADGNVWYGHNKIGIVNSIGGRRIDLKTGMIRAHFSDDYWTGFADRDEGPGCAFPTLSRHTGLGVPSSTHFIYGSPLKGEAEGFFLFSNGKKVRKVWLDLDEDEWWFKTIVGGGKKKGLPRSKGQTVGARDIKLIIKMVQVMPDGRIIVFMDGGFYEYREEEKEGATVASLICLMGYDDYKDDCTIPKRRKGVDMPKLGVLGGDGTYYLGTYFGSGYAGTTPCIWRMLPGEKLEPYSWVSNVKIYDGPAMNSRSHCGHHFWAQMHNYAFIAPDIMLPTAHDEPTLRRIRNGRVSSLCPDGEWRENVEKAKAVRWFWAASAPGPNGMAVGENCKISKSLPYIVTGIDFNKETVGPRIDTPTRKWPEEKDTSESDADKKEGE